MSDWIKTADSLPPVDQVVITKIDDHEGVRNEQPLVRVGNLWFFEDRSMYVYYRPTHWRWPTEDERIERDYERRRKLLSQREAIDLELAKTGGA